MLVSFYFIVVLTDPALLFAISMQVLILITVLVMIFMILNKILGLLDFLLIDFCQGWFSSITFAEKWQRYSGKCNFQLLKVYLLNTLALKKIALNYALALVSVHFQHTCSRVDARSYANTRVLVPTHLQHTLVTTHLYLCQHTCTCANTLVLVSIHCQFTCSCQYTCHSLALISILINTLVNTVVNTVVNTLVLMSLLVNTLVNALAFREAT
jgi:hypothetical protein